MLSLHQGKIAKRVMTRIWDSLSQREQAIVAADTACETELGKWFRATVASETKAKYESENYWLNERFSFYYSEFTPPARYLAA